MADTNDLFFFGDDFDAILGILEEEEQLDEQFREAADEVSIRFFLTTVFVDTRPSKTKHPWRRFRNFRQSYILSTDRIEIHQS